MLRSTSVQTIRHSTHSPLLAKGSLDESLISRTRPLPTGPSSTLDINGQQPIRSHRRRRYSQYDCREWRRLPHQCPSSRLCEGNHRIRRIVPSRHTINIARSPMTGVSSSCPDSCCHSSRRPHHAARTTLVATNRESRQDPLHMAVPSLSPQSSPIRRTLDRVQERPRGIDPLRSTWPSSLEQRRPTSITHQTYPWRPHRCCA